MRSWDLSLNVATFAGAEHMRQHYGPLTVKCSSPGPSAMRYANNGTLVHVQVFPTGKQHNNHREHTNNAALNGPIEGGAKHQGERRAAERTSWAKTCQEVSSRHQEQTHQRSGSLTLAIVGAMGKSGFARMCACINVFPCAMTRRSSEAKALERP